MWAWRNKLLLSLLYIYLKGGTKNEGTKVGRLKDIPVENSFRWKKHLEFCFIPVNITPQMWWCPCPEENNKQIMETEFLLLK